MPPKSDRMLLECEYDQECSNSFEIPQVCNVCNEDVVICKSCDRTSFINCLKNIPTCTARKQGLADLLLLALGEKKVSKD